jgi:hypothetical protein
LVVVVVGAGRVVGGLVGLGLAAVVATFLAAVVAGAAVVVAAFLAVVDGATSAAATAGGAADVVGAADVDGAGAALDDAVGTAAAAPTTDDDVLVEATITGSAATAAPGRPPLRTTLPWLALTMSPIGMRTAKPTIMMSSRLASGWSRTQSSRRLGYEMPGS